VGEPFGSHFETNVLRAKLATTIRFNPKTKERSLDQLRWGLIPHWANDQKIVYRTINARAETVDKAPSFRHYPEFRTIPSNRLPSFVSKESGWKYSA
jgi:putative SOS response-associated peptidase YedK